MSKRYAYPGTDAYCVQHVKAGQERGAFVIVCLLNLKVEHIHVPRARAYLIPIRQALLVLQEQENTRSSLSFDNVSIWCTCPVR